MDPAPMLYQCDWCDAVFTENPVLVPDDEVDRVMAFCSESCRNTYYHYQEKER